MKSWPTIRLDGSVQASIGDISSALATASGMVPKKTSGALFPLIARAPILASDFIYGESRNIEKDI
jgi:hypothetical protein